MAADDSALLTLESDQLTVTVSPRGAELQSVRSGDGAQWLWHGDPAYWSWHSPLLFPVVGRSPGDQVTVAGQLYPMPLHGFARGSRFETVQSAPDRCRLRLSATAASRSHYPFEFDLAIAFALYAATLTIRAEISNRDARPMPASFGFHPAFAWPLPGCVADELHVVRLAHPGEPAVRRLNADGLLKPEAQASPFHAGVLSLGPALFKPSALIFEAGTGSPLHYGVPGKLGITITHEGLPQLGVWTKPGAPFLCIEPWQGLPPMAGTDAALEKRPGIALLPPGTTQRRTMRLDFGARVPSND